MKWPLIKCLPTVPPTHRNNGDFGILDHFARIFIISRDDLVIDVQAFPPFGGLQSFCQHIFHVLWVGKYLTHVVVWVQVVQLGVHVPLLSGVEL